VVARAAGAKRRRRELILAEPKTGSLSKSLPILHSTYSTLRWTAASQNSHTASHYNLLWTFFSVFAQTILILRNVIETIWQGPPQEREEKSVRP